jgi:hypothetical protein
MSLGKLATAVALSALSTVSRRHAGALIAAALLLVAATAAASAEQVSCDDLSFKFDALGSKNVFCEAGSDTGRSSGSEGGTGWAADFEIAMIQALPEVVVMHAMKAGRRTVIPKLNVRDILGSSGLFGRAAGWGSAYELEGYEVQHFQGSLGDSGDKLWDCAGFVRHRGYVAVGGAGYRQRLSGAYCVVPPLAVDRNDLAGFLKSITF